MTKSKSTKRALLLSLLSMLLCVAMLTGSTFAWFTDSVVSGKNKIVAGNLDVELYHSKDADLGDKVGTTTKLFTGKDDKDVIWEPGVMVYENFTVENVGSLALKYKLTLNVDCNTVDGKSLNDVLKVAVVDGAFTGDRTAAKALTFDKTIADLKNTGKTGNIEANSADGHTFAIVIYWEPTDHDNDYNFNNNRKELEPLYIDFGVTLVATQATVESDSFDEYYDNDAVYPVVTNPISVEVEGNITKDSGGTLTDTASETSITVPANAVASDTNATFSMVLTDSTPDSATYEISLKDADGDAVALTSPATVTANIGTGLTNVTVKHSGNPMTKTDTVTDKDQTYNYNSSTGVLTIVTTTFSPFVIEYDFVPCASVNGVGYPSPNAAIAAAKDGETVVIQRSFSSNDMLFNLAPAETKNITVDLNGKTATYTSNNRAIQAAFEGNHLTIKNGTIVTKDVHAYGAVILQGATATFDNVTVRAQNIGVYCHSSTININNSNIQAYDAVQNSSNSTVNIKGSELSAERIGVFSTGAKSAIKIDDCTINSNYLGIYQSGNGGPNSFIITGSTITDSTGCGIFISNSTSTGAMQTLTVVNCKITGSTAIEFKHTNATIKNSTLTSTTADKQSREYGNGHCALGYAFAVTSNSKSDNITGTVTVTGCTDAYGNAIMREDAFVFQTADGASVTIDGTPVDTFNVYGE